MSVKDFYNAVTPGSSLTHGVGRGVYTMLEKDDICSAKTYKDEKVPTDGKIGLSLLNEVKLSAMINCLNNEYTAFNFALMKINHLNQNINLLDSKTRYANVPRLLLPTESSFYPKKIHGHWLPLF